MKHLVAFVSLLLLCAHAFAAPLQGWKHTGMMAVITTADGANLATGTKVENFPLLVRLHRDSFDFSQAKADGSDLAFSDDAGKILPHQIEHWDAKAGEASVWVRMAVIKGQEIQPLRMYWGKDSPTPSTTVFDAANGYLGVWHMGAKLTDDAGQLPTKDEGTKVIAGLIGEAREFSKGSYIDCGEKITGYPTGHEPHTTEFWFRPRSCNVSVVGWGVQERQGKAVVMFAGPPQIRTDCWFSNGNINSSGLITLDAWNHVVFSYENKNAAIYINGELGGKGDAGGTPMNIQSPARLTMGGWMRGFDYVGDLDEVRISKVARSAEWVKLQYENQKPTQSLVGPLVREGGTFAVTPEKTTINEGGTATISVRPAGALKLYWSLLRDGKEEVIAVDRYTLDFTPERVSANQVMTLRVKAIFRDGPKSRDIAIAVRDTIPDPVFTLQAPATWDGRSSIEIVPQIGNLAALKQAKAADVKIEWSTGNFALIKETVDGKLRLLGAQNSGSVTITATIHNGGKPVSQSVNIVVKEPAQDAWVTRVPEREEKPEEGQFYCRDDKNEGTLHYNGVLSEAADEVFLKVYADDKPYATQSAKPAADKSYSLSAKLKPGLIKYRIEFGTRVAGQETIVDRVGNLVCGDAFLIEGQSNAQSIAIDEPRDVPNEPNEWVRTFGGPQGFDDGIAWADKYNAKSQNGKRPSLWNLAVWRSKAPDHPTSIGWWGMEMAKQLVETQQIPICIINGAVGGTRIDQHQRNAQNPADLTTIYGKWLWRLQQARLTHGIRAVFWHQGENDQPAATPTGDYGWTNYHSYFHEMAAGWRRDMPNARRYFVFQIVPNSCGMGGADGAGDRLRERQRQLPFLYSNMSIMSTLGIKPAGGCHYPPAGYSEMARLIRPLVERDVYGKTFPAPISAPNLLKATRSASGDAITLEFDQAVVWNDALADLFYLDGEAGKVASGSVDGTKLTLRLKEATKAANITYLKEKSWKQDNLLAGANGIAALSFCEVEFAP